MDEDYDYDFSTYNSTSDSSFITNQQTDSLDQDDDNIQISHSQSPAPSSNEITDSHIAKRTKLSNKDNFIKSFFTFYEQPGHKPEDKSTTKLKCSIKGCQTKYVWHGSTTNMINHLRDVHHITKMSLHNKTADELKKSSQQTLETMLLKPYPPAKQQKLTQDVLRLFISCTLPLYLVENKNFRTFLHSFDPRYKPPCVNTFKNEIANGTNHTTQVIKNMIHSQANTISLTFDLWTSRAHDSYLGVTCHWISDEFRMYDLTLSVVEMGAYKTAGDIVDSIEPLLEEFSIEGDKILSITTDNGSNVKAAVTRLSASLSLSTPIANIFCAAHTLQLSVETGLVVVQNLITKCKALISLMSREKKRKQLREAQIRWLANDLENSNNNDNRRDGTNIRDKLLTNEEFSIAQELVNLLSLFDKATEILSGSNYATLGIMVPTVEELIYRFSNIDSEIDIINEVKETILSNLTSRWSLPHDYGMFASLLDPRFKDLSFCSNAQKRRMIEELKIKFNELSKHENQHDESPEQTELDRYLLLPEINKTEENNPLDWWKWRKAEFPILSILARRYLAIPATS
ncbi:7693_t:CDS:2, partial [Cetraspora pellucida]